MRFDGERFVYLLLQQGQLLRCSEGPFKLNSPIIRILRQAGGGKTAQSFAVSTTPQPNRANS
jgi:hypothetical protein